MNIDPRILQHQNDVLESKHQQNASVINALKRLERAGSEDSRATEKLCLAAGTLAAHLRSLMPQEGRFILYGLGISRDRLVFWPEQAIYGPEEIISPAEHLPSRRAALQLAEAVVAGWLDEIADWMERRAATAEQGTEPLLATAERLRRE